MLATFTIFQKSSVAAKIRLNHSFFLILHSKYLLSRFSETTKQVLILSNGNKNIHYDALKKFYELKTLYATLSFKGALSGLRQFLEIESPLKMMKNTFYFTSKALFVLKIFKCFS